MIKENKTIFCAGRKRGHHRGGFKNFTNMEDLAAEEERRKNEEKWKVRMNGAQTQLESQS